MMWISLDYPAKIIILAFSGTYIYVYITVSLQLNLIFSMAKKCEPLITVL